MTNIAKSRRGQFIVAAAMFIALIILSMSLMIYSAGSRYQTLEKEPVREIVQTITDDFKRMLTIALADYSRDKATNAFKKAVSRWANKTLYCYSGMGLQLDVNIAGNSPYLNYSLGKDSFEIGANVTLNLNITSIGFYGYTYPAQLKLNVTVSEVSWSLNPARTDVTFLNITVKAFKEGYLPVSDLEITQLKITVSNSTTPPKESETIDISEKLNIVYLSGDGIYVITLNNTVQTSLSDIQDLNVSIKFIDGRGIQGYVQKRGISLVKPMYVGGITMAYEYVQQGKKYYIFTNVTILDEFEQPVSGATVYLSITLPDPKKPPKKDHTQTGVNGIAEFVLTLESDPKKGDTFTATVVNVVKKGYFYDPSRNVLTEASLEIQN